MSNVIPLKKNYDPEITDFLNGIKAGIVDFGILAYRYPSGSTWVISISNNQDIPDIDVIELLEHLIESVKNPQEFSLP